MTDAMMKRGSDIKELLVRLEKHRGMPEFIISTSNGDKIDRKLYVSIESDPGFHSIINDSIKLKIKQLEKEFEEL